MKSDRYLASRLLSKKEGLSVLEKEEILGNILRDQAAREPERAPRGLVVARRLAGVALLAVAIMVPVLLLNTSDPPPDEFLPRGGQAQSVYTVRCLGRNGETSCHQGDKLLFEFSASIKKCPGHHTESVQSTKPTN